jgi:hypothetical protein
VAVANQGISGNGLLNDGFGASILARFDREVLASPGVTHLVLLGGMNDITYSIAPGDVDPEFAGIMTTDAPIGTADVIAAYRQIVERAHAHGVAVFGATLTPYGGSGSSTRTVKQPASTSTTGSGAAERSTRSSTSTPCGAIPRTPLALRPASTSATTCTATTPATERWQTRSTSGCSTDRPGSRTVRAVR